MFAIICCATVGVSSAGCETGGIRSLAPLSPTPLLAGARFDSVAPSFPALVEPVSGAISGEQPWILRSRLVRVDLLLLQSESPLRLQFAPYPEVDAVLELQPAGSVRSGNLWIGQAAGERPDSTLMIVAEAFLTGNVRIGAIDWHIRPADAGLHWVEEVDPRRMPAHP